MNFKLLQSIILICLILIVFSMFPSQNYGCSVVSKSIEYFYNNEDIEGIIYGDAISVKNGRQANIQVISYISPQRLAEEISLPKTNRTPMPRNTSCEGVDLSDKFDEGKKYIVFLSSVSPNIELLAPDGYTAFEVSDGYLLDSIRDIPLEPIDLVLSSFSEQLNLPLRDFEKDINSVTLFIVFLGLILLGYMGFKWISKTRRRGNHKFPKSNFLNFK
ncbi:hypothetical protein VQL36_06670 [Chengkuizengella sp. SCS-71B]|uniref:hypothetical protein n=1 Tax=Chengkuizengella sp. SCS-71B TaxID=3115290 RepID=UPI0032C2351B